MPAAGLGLLFCFHHMLHRLRILDFNVWSGLTYLGLFRMGRYGDDSLDRARENSMIAQIQKLDPDVVCLHELNPVYARARRLSERLNMDVYSYMHLAGIRVGPIGMPWNLAEGDAIFARRGLNLRPVGRLQLTGGPVRRFTAWNFNDATQILGASITLGSKVVPVFTTHWHAGVAPGPDIVRVAEEMIERESIPRKKVEGALALLDKNSSMRQDEAAKTLAFVDKHSDGCAFLSGDFNAIPGTPEISALTKAGFRDTLGEMQPGGAGPTWHYDANPLHQRFYKEYDPDPFLRLNYVRLRVPHRLDYVFYKQGGARLKHSEIVMKDLVDGVMASDHFGVMADFEIPA